MKANRIWYVVFVVVFSSVTMASVLYARPYGRVGRSGKQGSSCSDCHFGSNTPKVNFTSPAAASAGETIDLAFTVRRSSTDNTSDEAGFNVAIEGGELLGKNETPETCTGVVAPSNSNLTCISLVDGLTEISHARPASMENNEYTFEFRWTVPITPGTYTLYGAGVAALTGAGAFNTDVHPGMVTTTVSVFEPTLTYLPLIRLDE